MGMRLEVPRCRQHQPTGSTTGGYGVFSISSMLELGSDITVADLAEVACLSRFHFLRAFKVATGVTPHRYLSDLRLDHAKALLRQGDISLGDLAQACRFTSQANFSRAFRRAVGMSPGAYRRAMR